MIGLITGIIQQKKLPSVMIVTHGVGYEIETSLTTFLRLPDVGKEVALVTHLSIREDAHVLFGFYDESERILFRALIKVNGIGPKLALAILSSVDVKEFVRLVRSCSSNELTRIPGVGKKTADRLIIEMRDKLKEWTDVDADITTTKMASPQLAEREAMDALLALGYKPQEASRVLNKIEKNNLNSEQLIRLALQQMVQHD